MFPIFSCLDILGNNDDEEVISDDSDKCLISKSFFKIISCYSFGLNLLLIMYSLMNSKGFYILLNYYLSNFFLVPLCQFFMLVLFSFISIREFLKPFRLINDFYYFGKWVKEFLKEFLCDSFSFFSEKFLIFIIFSCCCEA